MSSSYTTEPPPNGRVTLETSCGPLDIFLFSNEAPKHCRHFLSLVEAEYFTSTPHRTVFFHRLVKDFVVQFGGPQGTSYHLPSLAAASSKRASSSTTDFPPSSIEAAALSASVEQHLLSPPVGGSVDPPAPRPEKHSRLRFIHRGLLCHARRPPPPPPIGSSSSSSSSASASPDVGVGCGEFFLTLSDTSTLDKEGYTIVGTVRGQTLFNLARVADVSANAAIEALGGEDEAAAKGGGGALDVPAAAAVKVLRATVVETPTMVERRDEQDLKEGGGMTQGRKLLSLPWDDKFVSERMKAGEGGEANLKPEQERKKRLKAVRNVNVLSFGGDEEEGDDGAPPIVKPMQQASKKPKASVVEIDKSTTEQKVARPPSPPPLPASQAQQQQSRAAEDPDDAATPPSDSDSDSDSDVPKGRSAPASSSVPSSSKKSVVDDMRSKFLAAKAAKAAAFGGSLVAVGGAADKEAARRKEEETLARLEEFQRKRKTN